MPPLQEFPSHKNKQRNTEIPTAAGTDVVKIHHIEAKLLPGPSSHKNVNYNGLPPPQASQICLADIKTMRHCQKKKFLNRPVTYILLFQRKLLQIARKFVGRKLLRFCYGT
jgi:hypothetical protein